MNFATITVIRRRSRSGKMFALMWKNWCKKIPITPCKNIIPKVQGGLIKGVNLLQAIISRGKQIFSKKTADSNPNGQFTQWVFVPWGGLSLNSCLLRCCVLTNSLKGPQQPLCHSHTQPSECKQAFSNGGLIRVNPRRRQIFFSLFFSDLLDFHQFSNFPPPFRA